jgi:hypothetical protein
MISSHRSISFAVSIGILTALAPSASLLLASPESLAENSVASGQMRLTFPESYSFGRVHFRNGSKEVPARGTLVVPSATTFELAVSYEGAQHLAAVRKLSGKGLARLNLRRFEISDQQLKHIEHLYELDSLDLSETDVTDKGMASVAKLRNLQSLNLRSTLVTGKCISKLKDLPRLASLILEVTSTADEGLDDLPSMKNLIDLSLTRTSISDKALKSISKMPKLTKLSVAFNSRITDSGMKYLSGMRYLTELSIANTDVTTASINSLKRIRSLKRLIYSSNQFSDRDVIL